MKKWDEIKKDSNEIYIFKEKPFSYEFIKINRVSKKMLHGIVNLKSYLVNPILIELNYKRKLEDSIEYVLFTFEQHGFSRYTKKEKTFSSEENLYEYFESLKKM